MSNKYICIIIILFCIFQILPAQELIQGREFLEEAFSTVSIISYFDQQVSRIDPEEKLALLYDMGARWYPASFAVRSTQADGSTLFGDSADGVIEGAVMKARTSSILQWVAIDDILTLQLGFLVDLIAASHITDGWRLMFEDMHYMGGTTGFSAQAYAPGAAARIILFNILKVSWVGFVRQCSPYDSETGEFISNFSPEYSGLTTNNPTSNTEDLFANQSPGNGLLPAEAVPYRQEYFQIIQTTFSKMEALALLESSNLKVLELGYRVMRNTVEWALDFLEPINDFIQLIAYDAGIRFHYRAPEMNFFANAPSYGLHGIYRKDLPFLRLPSDFLNTLRLGAEASLSVYPTNFERLSLFAEIGDDPADLMRLTRWIALSIRGGIDLYNHRSAGFMTGGWILGGISIGYKRTRIGTDLTVSRNRLEDIQDGNCTIDALYINTNISWKVSL